MITSNNLQFSPLENVVTTRGWVGNDKPLAHGGSEAAREDNLHGRDGGVLLHHLDEKK